MDWSELMEKAIYNVLFMLSILFLYVIFGYNIVVITLLSLIYLNLGNKNE